MSPGEGRSPMSDHIHSDAMPPSWATDIASLVQHEIGAGATERRLLSARRGVLDAHRPTGFSSIASPDDPPIDLVTLLLMVEVAETLERAAIEREAEARREQLTEQVRIDEAATGPAPDGEWQGFTFGRALAWCRALSTYEPFGFIAPGSQLRAQRTRDLEAGRLPNVAVYARRARALEAAGTDPSGYVRARQMIGARMFSEDDIRRI